MVCTPFREGNATGFVCGPRRRFRLCACGSRARAILECDWKVPDRKSGTCDAQVCQICSTSPAPGKDLCPAHAQAWMAWKTEKGSA